jgi:hypothetical protein
MNLSLPRTWPRAIRYRPVWLRACALSCCKIPVHRRNEIYERMREVYH